MFPIPSLIPLILNILMVYMTWWTISRLGLLGAWVWSKPGTIKLKQWLLIVAAILPFCMEIISSILVIFALAFGVEPRRVNHE